MINLTVSELNFNLLVHQKKIVYLYRMFLYGTNGMNLKIFIKIRLTI